MTGAYLTRDGGQHYRQLNFPGGTQSFAFDPTDDKIIYAGSVALYRSVDRGVTWQQIYPRPEQVVKRVYSGDHADLNLKTDPSVSYWDAEQTIRAIHVDPADLGRIYFTVGSLLFFSVDAGVSWNKKELTGTLEYVYVHPGGGSIYTFSRDSLFVLDPTMHIKEAFAYPAAMRPAERFAAGVVKGTVHTMFYGLHRDGVGAVWVSADGS